MAFSEWANDYVEVYSRAWAAQLDAQITRFQTDLPSAADLDAIAEEDRIREATNGNKCLNS